MLQRALSVCAVLGLASAAQAGVIVTLVPSNNGGPLNPGDMITVDVMAEMDQAGPASIRLRLAQFDLSDTSPALLAGIEPVSTHPDAEVPFRFWDFTSTTNCQGDSTVCGDRYLIDGELPSPPDPVNIFNVAFSGSTQNNARMLELHQGGQTRLGRFHLTIPQGTPEGSYLIDVLNANELNENLGADFRYGFGTPTDPSVILRAADGEILPSPNQAGGLPITVVPEPATLAMLGLGGLAAAFRRRRSA